MECLYELRDEVSPNHRNIFQRSADDHARQLGSTSAINTWLNIQKPTILASISHALRSATNNVINISEYFKNSTPQQNNNNIQCITEARKRRLPIAKENDIRKRINKAIQIAKRKVRAKRTNHNSNNVKELLARHMQSTDQSILQHTTRQPGNYRNRPPNRGTKRKYTTRDTNHHETR